MVVCVLLQTARQTEPGYKSDWSTQTLNKEDQSSKLWVGENEGSRSVNK